MAAVVAGCLAPWPWAASAPLGAELRDFAARYEGHKRFGPLTATATAQIRLQRSAQHIVYTMDTTVRLAFIERSFHDCSVVRVAGEQLQPLEYVHLDAADPKHNVRTVFDWARGEARTVVGAAGDAVATPIVWPTWDPMSFQVALMALAPSRAAGASEVHSVIERGALKVHRVRFSGMLPAADEASPGRLHEIVSQKEGRTKGQIMLLLTPQPTWRPARLTIEEVTIELVGAAPAAPALSDRPVPQCRTGLPE